MLIIIIIILVPLSSFIIIVLLSVKHYIINAISVIIINIINLKKPEWLGILCQWFPGRTLADHSHISPSS